MWCLCEIVFVVMPMPCPQPSCLPPSTHRRAIGRDNPRRKVAYVAFGAVAAVAVVDIAIAIHAARNRRDDNEAAA